MKSRPTNPFISEKCRKLLQAMNARGYSLDYDELTGYYRNESKNVPAAVAEEALRLCAVKTHPEPTRYPCRRYVVSDEGNRLLTMPNYVPAMEVARQELRANIRASHKCQS